MRIQDLNKYFAKGDQAANQKLVDLMGEAGVDLEKAGKVLEEKKISIKDQKDAVNYGIALGQFMALTEFGLGLDIDKDESNVFALTPVIVEGEKKVEEAAKVCPLANRNTAQ